MKKEDFEWNCKTRFAKQYMYFPSSKLELYKQDDSLKGGSCMALVLSYFAEEEGRNFEKLVKAPNGYEILTRQCVSVMTEQKGVFRDSDGLSFMRPTLFKNWHEWLKRIGPGYGLVKVEHHLAEDSTPRPLHLARSVWNWARQNNGIYFVGFNGDVGGHAIGFKVEEKLVHFYDPNVGIAKDIPRLDNFFNFLAFHFADPAHKWNRWMGVRMKPMAGK
jgi:hypothetical protein